MTHAVHPSARQARQRLPFERIALVLQGGGALGAYQGGVFQALTEAGVEPDWLAGISIGSFNAAIIAGNPPEHRVEKLQQFWRVITTHYFYWRAPAAPGAEPGTAPIDVATVAADLWNTACTLFPGSKADALRGWFNQWAAGNVLFNGTPAFFALRPVSPWLWPEGSMRATSYYDTRALKSTLEQFVDFDRINAGAMRLSVGAVNVKTGNLIYFDSTEMPIRPEHIMASGALPPAFPAVEIDGEFYWDGGLVSNAPLYWVVTQQPQRDTLVFQVDLWPARGELPLNMSNVNTRQKEIIYSSRTRATSRRFIEMQRARNTLAMLLDKLPPELADGPEAMELKPLADRKVWNLIHIIYRAKDYEGDSKDYEFSRLSMEDHWRAGYDDTVRTLAYPEVLERPQTADGVFAFDIAEQDNR